MNDSIDPTVIRNSVKDLNKFLAINNSGKNRESSSDMDNSIRYKLNFSESFDHDSFSAEFSSLNDSSFIRKHKESIVGFDVAKKIREKDKEIIEAKSKITVLESKLGYLDAVYKKTRIEHDAEIETYSRKQETYKEMIEELESKIKQMKNQEREVKEEGERIKKSSEANCSQFGKKMLQLQTSNFEKMESLQEVVSQTRERIRILEKEAEQSSTSAHVLEFRNKELEERINSLGKRFRDAEETQLKLETMTLKLNQANLKITEYELRFENLKNQENNLYLLENAMKQLPVLNNQVQKLKEENHVHRMMSVNVSLLEEKLSSCKTQLRIFENRCKELTSENATLVTLRDLSEQYEVTLKKEFNLEYLPPVAEFVEMVQQLKKKDEGVTNSLSELKASLDSHAHSKDEQEDLIKSLRETVENNKIDMEKNAQIIRRCQRKMFMLSKERDSLKDIISSYESESTLNLSKLEQERIAHLESQLSDYKEEISKLEEELNKPQKVGTYQPKKLDQESQPEKKPDSSKFEQLEKTLSQLSEENDALKKQLKCHEVEGSYESQQTKVLQFLDNPLEKAYQSRKAEFEKLSEENEALKKRIQLLEQGEDQDLTQKVGMKVATDAPNSKQLKELEEKASSLEIRNKRLIEAFKLKSQAMREVVYSLTGYRVDMRGDNHYKLSNMYSDSPDDYLLFEQSEDGVLHLLETSFSATLENLIDSYLQQERSYPAFLSTLTLNLFQRQTMQHGSSSDQEEEEYEAGEEYYEGGEEEEELEGGEEEEEEEEDDEVGDEYEEEEDDDEEEEDRPSKRIRTDSDQPEDDEDDELICLD